MTGAAADQYTTSATIVATLLAHLNTSKKPLTSRNLTASTNETKQSFEEYNVKWEKTTIEPEALEGPYSKRKELGLKRVLEYSLV